MIVRELWRYPVKSMGGERLESCAVGETGLVGDRCWGLVDQTTGLVLTARRVPALLYASARLTASGGVEILLPDGRVTDDSAALSAWLDQPVVLQRAGDEGGVFEIPVDEAEVDWFSWPGAAQAWHDSPDARVSIVSTGTIGAWDVRRFRPNVVLDGAGEDAYVGSSVQIGALQLKVTGRIGRCVMVNRPQPAVAGDLEVLRRITLERQACLAVGAVVSAPGHLRVGDELR